MKHLFGCLLTQHGNWANCRGEADGNINLLQKISSRGAVYSSFSGESVRFAYRYYWQLAGYKVNRIWKQDTGTFHFECPNFDPHTYIDDDVLGYMRADAARKESHEDGENKKTSSNEGKNRTSKPKGHKVARRGALDVCRAVSTTPYEGDVSFNAVSGEKGRTSLYGTEYHATRYQYGFAITPESLVVKNRIFAVLDAIISVGRVAGNNARWLNDFSPENLILRWTDDFSPRILFSFEESHDGEISIPSLIRKLNSGDVTPSELWISGPISDIFEEFDVNKFDGVKAAVESLKSRIQQDLEI